MAHHGRNVHKENDIPTDAPPGPIADGTTTPETRNTDMTQVNRATEAGAGKHRGDQRDRGPNSSGKK